MKKQVEKIIGELDPNKRWCPVCVKYQNVYDMIPGTGWTTCCGCDEDIYEQSN